MTEVAIVGFASSTRELANQVPESVEIWSMNQAYRLGFLKRADRWFDLHSRTLWDTTLEARRPADYLRWLQAFDGPVYLLEQQPDIPKSLRYPIEAVIENVGDYLTSTVAYMLALAIMERFSTIHLYGVDMATNSEYADQRACCEYLIGLARGRGIKILLPEVCPLIKGPLYGRGAFRPEGETITDAQYRARLTALQKRKADLERQMAGLTADRNMLEGAILETQYWINVTPEGVSQAALAPIDRAAWNGVRIEAVSLVPDAMTYPGPVSVNGR